MAVVAVMVAVVVAVLVAQPAAAAEAATATLYLLFQNLMVSFLLTMTTAPKTSLYL